MFENIGNILLAIKRAPLYFSYLCVLCVWSGSLRQASARLRFFDRLFLKNS